MNKKLLAGLASVVAVSGFWACGDGNINEMTTGDEIILNLYNTDEDKETFKNEALENCKADTLGCYLKYQGYFDGTEELPVASSSDAENPTSSTTTPVTSSSSSMNIVIKSSSSITIVDNTSSSSVASGVVTDGFASCAPSKDVINKGESVVWSVTPGSGSDYSPIDFAKASVAWSFSEGAEDDGTGAQLKSGKVTYNQFGTGTATATVTMEDGHVETVTCSSLQVNGAAITGCKCEPDVASPDVKDGPVTVTWTVSGCTSDATITDADYSWGTGVTGAGTTATGTVNAKNDEITPVVTVSNSESTKLDVTCTGVKAIDGSAPDYEITAANDPIPVKAGSATIVVSVSHANFNCQPSGSMTGGTITCGSTTTTITEADQWYINISCSESTVDVNLPVDAKCGVY